MSSPPITTGSASISHRTFSALVQNDADLVGHVAYALYKRDKLKFSEEFRARNSREPLPAEVEIFIVGCNLDTRLQGYRAEAELLLEAMTEYQLDDAIEQVRIDANEELARKLSESKSWGRPVFPCPINKCGRDMNEFHCLNTRTRIVPSAKSSTPPDSF